MGNKPPEIWSPPQPESDFCPEKAVDVNGDLFSGRYAYRVSLSLRIESHCQLLIAEDYSKLQLTFDYTHIGRSVANLNIIDI